jgi:hypothetical protein
VEEGGDIDLEKSWEGLTDKKGCSTGLQDGWGGVSGKNKTWEGPREGESFAGASDAWKGRESPVSTDASRSEA